MEMAMYIMNILHSQVMVMWSWGFHNPVAIENGLRFLVQGFKFKGTVQVLYCEGKDLFSVSLIKNGKEVKTIEDVYIDNLVQVIDEAVEHCPNYEDQVNKEYSI